MDELDVKILRALVYESAISPSNPRINLSLRAIATRLGVDDMTVSFRYKKLKESGAMSVWQLLVNPSYFGCKLLDLMVDVSSEPAKGDMVRKLKLIQGVMILTNFYGKALRILLMYSSEESRSRTVELIPRITNPESLTQSRMAFPGSKSERLTETDVAIIRALSKDARKPVVIVAKELGISSKTVRNRVDKLRRENTIFAYPTLNVSVIPGLIPVILSYSYSSTQTKATVDHEVLSHFESNYFWGGFSDPANGYIMLSAPTAADIQKFLEWAKSQSGVASARVDIPIEQISNTERLSELLELENEAGILQKKALL